LIEALNGDTDSVPPPSLPPLPSTVNPTLLQEAIAFLRRSNLSIEPRKKWSPGGLPQYRLKGNIPANLQASPGRTLSVWGDAGWGSLVRQGKYHDGRFSDELLAACLSMLQEWRPQPPPTWVTCIPSLRHPGLVSDFAQRLAGALGLPFHAALRKTGARPEQKTMANSIQQARNVDGSLAIVGGALPRGAVLLVDDMVDSRWTITIAAWLLRSQGSGEVYPLALAQTGHDQ
jgi:ATP-dependent DNA helicase RecQ